LASVVARVLPKRVAGVKTFVGSILYD
jgi:hypothetical protein